jgi:ABC-2 type transport system ATP-binding protein
VLPTEIEGQKRTNGTLAFTYKTSQTRADQILSLVHDAGITIKDVRTEDPDLEDVFLNLTKD